MVNQAEQIDSNENSVEGGNTTTDITNEFSGVDTFEDASTSPEDITTTEPSSSEGQEAVEQPSSEQAATTPAPAPEEGTPVPESNNVPDNTVNITQRIEELEQQNTQYQQQQQQSQLQSQSLQYRQQLEQQGYLPEQATQIAQSWMAQQSQLAETQQQQERQVRFYQGQAAAAEHFADRYKLNISDLAELRNSPDPKSMEATAKRMASDRKKDARIAELEARLVPQQTFDDSQSTPAASNNQDRLLERYNQGDRSSEAQAAARRAAGLS